MSWLQWPKDMIKAYLVAYDAFLWSEEDRHWEDIVAIKKKRGILNKAGFKAELPGPWITEDEIEEAGKILRKP